MQPRRLAAGVASLPVALRDGCRASVLHHQAADGGFRGRAGEPDDWYTSFAVRVLALTGGADDALRRTSAWLGQRQSAPATAADAACRVQAAFLLNLLGLPTQLAQAAVLGVLAAPSGTSAAYLAAEAWTCLGRRPPDPAPLLALQNPDGGFAEHAGAASQTNATAAALVRLGRNQPPADRTRAVAWLAALQGEDGGMRTNLDAPAGDLLSTFVTCWALTDQPQALRLGDLARFVQSCRVGDGFGACPGDAESDPEYTFYGLALLGRLAAQAGRQGSPPPIRRGPVALLMAWSPTRRLGWSLVR